MCSSIAPGSQAGGRRLFSHRAAGGLRVGVGLHVDAEQRQEALELARCVLASKRNVELLLTDERLAAVHRGTEGVLALADVADEELALILERLVEALGHAFRDAERKR